MSKDAEPTSTATFQKMSHQTLRIATRSSKLALWQANCVLERLKRFDPSLQAELIPLRTQGDILQQQSLAQIGGKGLFVKELEVALMEGKADIAVHSMKDMPAQTDETMPVAAILARDDARDALITSNRISFEQLSENARVGTSSLRRQCQLQRLRPDLRFLPLRGNVDTRLRKLDDGEYDAIVLSAAGLLRLDLGDRISQFIPPDMCLPAAGQGAIGIQVLHDNYNVRTKLALLDDPDTSQCVQAERIIAWELGASCQIPLAAHARLNGSRMTLKARIGHPDGRTMIGVCIQGPAQDGIAMARALSRSLICQGAQKLISLLRYQIAHDTAFGSG